MCVDLQKCRILNGTHNANWERSYLKSWWSAGEKLAHQWVKILSPSGEFYMTSSTSLQRKITCSWLLAFPKLELFSPQLCFLVGSPKNGKPNFHAEWLSSDADDVADKRFRRDTDGYSWYKPVVWINVSCAHGWTLRMTADKNTGAVLMVRRHIQPQKTRCPWARRRLLREIHLHSALIATSNPSIHHHQTPSSRY